MGLAVNAPDVFQRFVTAAPAGIGSVVAFDKCAIDPSSNGPGNGGGSFGTLALKLSMVGIKNARHFVQYSPS